MDLKSNQIASASPAVSAVGVPETITPEAEYGEYDVQISVTFSPKTASVATVATKTERMSRKKYEAFREDTNLWDGKKFLEEYFPDELEKALKNNPQDQNRPQVFVVNSATGEVSDGQVQNGTYAQTKSSVDTTNVPAQITEKAQVKRAPAAVKDSAYVAPVGGSEQPEGNVANFPYEANDTNDYKVEDAVAAANDPQEPEQPKPANPAKGFPEQEGTDTAEQPNAAARVAEVQGGDTAATEASREHTAQPANPTADAGNAPGVSTDNLNEQAQKAAKSQSKNEKKSK